MPESRGVAHVAQKCDVVACDGRTYCILDNPPSEPRKLACSILSGPNRVPSISHEPYFSLESYTELRSPRRYKSF